MYPDVSCVYPSEYCILHVSRVSCAYLVRSVLHFPVWVPEGNQSVWGFNQKWYAYQKYRYTIPLSQRIKELKKRTALAARARTQCVTRPLTDSGRSICLGLCSLTCCHESPPPPGLFLATVLHPLIGGFHERTAVRTADKTAERPRCRLCIRLTYNTTEILLIILKHRVLIRLLGDFDS